MDGLQALGRFPVFFCAFVIMQFMPRWFDRWPGAAPFLAVGVPLLLLVAGGWFLCRIDRAARVRQGYAPQQRVISRPWWVVSIISVVLGAGVVVAFLLAFRRDGEWITVSGAVVFAALTLIGALRLRRRWVVP
ncbi:hypothetical protein [Rothia santali]|uniref:hypothetical protein n=1 Tax=Rothia santali TaxID=2949643 RepID=UPI0020B18CDB|nr:hypothetical protein [Rothia santali]